MCRSVVFCVAALAVLPADPAPGQARSADRQVPVFVRAEAARTAVDEGSPIGLTVTVTNGLPRVIFLSGAWTEPVDWNGETISISVVDVYRDGEPGNLLIARPDVTLPAGVSGIGRVGIESGRSLSVRTDARKWTLRDGWLPGSYRITVRVDNLVVDDYSTLSVTSDPIEFAVE
jgi:hypothetical protein